MWWKKNDNTSKNPVNSEEYERLAKRITELVAELGLLKANYKIIETDVDNLRGNFNRKLKGLVKEEEKVAPKEEEKSETYINDGFVAFG